MFDAGSVAQWGRLRWQGENGAGAIALRTRSGNSLRPDPTWSDWSDAYATPARRSPARTRAFCSIEAELSGSGVTLENVSAAYLPQNNPPVVQVGDGADHGDAGHAAREGRVNRQRRHHALQRHRDRHRAMPRR